MASVLVLALVTGAIDLTWGAPVGCPERTAIIEQLEAAAPHAGEVDLVVTATISADPWRARLAIQGEARTLEAGSCEALGRAIVLILAVTIDALASAPPPSSVATATLAAAPVIRAEAPPSPAASSAPGVGIRVG